MKIEGVSIFQCQELAFVFGQIGHYATDFSSTLFQQSHRVKTYRFDVLGELLCIEKPVTHAANDTDELLFFKGWMYGEIDSNYRALVKILSLNGHLSSYIEVPQGEYIAIYINKKAGSLSCIRDPHGILPLYLLKNSKKCILGESWECLAKYSCGTVDKKHITNVLIEDYTSYGTPLLDISVIPPGNLYQFSDIKKEIKIKQAVNTAFDFPEASLIRQPIGDEWVALLHELYESLTESIDWLTGDKDEVHVLLSGGLDSTLIATIARKVLGKRVIAHTFKPQGPIVLGETDINECINVASPHEHCWLPIIDETLFEMTKEASLVTGAIVPFLHGGARLALAREIGRRSSICLGGEGSDEYFIGYPYMYAVDKDLKTTQPATMRWSAPAELKHPNPRQRFINEMQARVRSLKLMKDGETLGRHLTEKIGEVETENMRFRHAQWDRRYILGNYSLRYVGRELDEKGGLNTYLPFLNPCVTQIAKRVSPNIHIYDGRGKFILREMAKHYNLLSDVCINRDKQGFIATPGISSAWLEIGVVKRHLDNSAVEKTDIFNVDGVEMLKKKLMSGNNKDILDQMLLHSIWTTQVILLSQNG